MSIKLLIVDDSRLARMSVIRALSKLRPGATYIEAGHPDEAMTLMRNQRPEAAVVDFNMPGRDGLALTAELRALDPVMPVAILSANAQDEIIFRANELGATFIVKPLTESAFADFLGSAFPAG